MQRDQAIPPASHWARRFALLFAARRALAGAASLLILTVLPAAADAQTADPVAEIPYRIDYGGWFTVEATINGRGPYAFVIDTGSTLSLVFQKLDDEHHFPLMPDKPKRVLGLASGGVLPVYLIGDIDVAGLNGGDARLENHRSVVLPDWAPPRRTPDGVLGLDFLSRYFVVFGRPARTLRLYEKNSAIRSNFENWSSTQLRADNFGLASGDLFTLEGRIQRRPIRFILDLGASGTLINEAAFSSLLTGVFVSNSGDPLRRSSARIIGAFDREDKVVMLDVRRFKIDRTTWRRQRFMLYNPAIFEELGVNRKAYGLAGADLFVDRSFAIDFLGRRIYIGPVYKGSRDKKARRDADKG